MLSLLSNIISFALDLFSWWKRQELIEQGREETKKKALENENKALRTTTTSDSKWLNRVREKYTRK